MEPRDAAELELCLRNRSYHIENHIVIKDLEGQVRLMNPLKRAQKKLGALLHYCRDVWKIAARIIVCKSRKIGISSYVVSDMLIEVQENGIDGIVIAHDRDSATYLFEIGKRAYLSYDLPKPTTQRSNKKELKFDGQEGYIEVLTANRVNASRSRSPHYILSSEAAFWEKGIYAAVALFQSVHKNPHTTHIIESTPNGEDGLFKPYWDNAQEFCELKFDQTSDGDFIPVIKVKDEEKWNGFIPFYVGAVEDEFCREKVTEDEANRLIQTIDNYERMLIDKLGAGPEFIKWRRRKIISDCQGDLRVFKAEFSCFPEEGFITTGYPRFEIDKLDLMPVEDGNLGYLKQIETWDRRINFIRDRNELLKIFRSPVNDHAYCIGIDTAEGIIPEGSSEGDRTIMLVIDLDEGGFSAQVATYAGHVSEEYLLGPLKLLGEWYNMAYLVPEVGGGHGIHLIDEIKKVYPIERIYHRLDMTGEQLHASILGWKTHAGNRKRLIDDLAKLLADGLLIVRDRDTIKELKAFKRTRGGHYEAAKGFHDDHVISLALTVQGMKTYPEIEAMHSDLPVPPWEVRKAHKPESVTVGRNTITGY